MRRASLIKTPVAWLAGLIAGQALGQATPQADAPPVQLRPSPALAEQIDDQTRRLQPIFLFGDSVRSRPDLETVVDGNAELRRGDIVIRADRLEYYQPEDRAKARGRVRVNRAGNLYEGTEVDLRMSSFEGHFLQPTYRFLSTGGHGSADRIEFLDDKRMVARNATYTTCRRDPGPGWMPDWIVRAASVKLDYENDVGEAEAGVLRFKDIPVLPIPSFSFPLSERRKSGVLPPTINLDNLGGLELTVPYYWNIAPQRDATLYPTLMTKRGLDLGAEFRYLERDYSGVVRGSAMPEDALRGKSRWSTAVEHRGHLADGRVAGGDVAYSLNVTRVSDDDYWRDFPRVLGSLTQRLLPGDARVSWDAGPVSAFVRTQKWQTLQDVAAPIVPPYDRLPQLGLRYQVASEAGVDMQLDGELTRFQGDRVRTGQPDANRAVAIGQISRPWRAPGWFVVPKVQMHLTSYSFDTPLITGQQAAQRSVPTFSLDSGLVFERESTWFGRSLRQTLEPRAMMVYTPYRDQTALPVYDSASTDYNFATIYGENAFFGNDRIADARLLTLGMTSRLIDPASGAEAARFGIAQRVRFADQIVALPGALPVTDRLGDLLAGGALNWTREWALDSTVQFNLKTERSVRSSTGVRYNPGPFRVVSAAYRLQRGASEQLDVGWQWPLDRIYTGPGRWYSVGRMNYSMRDNKLVDSILGFEYEADCWIARVVVERLQRSANSANQRIMFQIEFTGFSRLGSNPLQTLKENIPRYQMLREQVNPPSRFTQYD